MYYFAYGSNMNLEHMRRICGWHFSVLGGAILEDYQFGPDTRGYSNIRPCPGQKVFGVLYQVEQWSINALDEFEGCPTVFNRGEVIVKDFEGETYKAWVYLESPEYFGEDEIKEDYLKRVLIGAQENHLPAEWINFLTGFEKNKS
ncbi:MAG: gamma-glutamylcyclotransferase family protein [Candidatus Doudnabacteria bacterium]|jgi:gamma-glutamylcyclotransferase (GGCT)/AIG2-like uncharacterized protein YtfP